MCDPHLVLYWQGFWPFSLVYAKNGPTVDHFNKFLIEKELCEMENRSTTFH